MKKISLFMLMAVGLLISGNLRAGDVTAADDAAAVAAGAVAKIGDQYYSTFANAIAAVPKTNEETVVELIQNCTANGVSIATYQNVTLNCNLFTLTNSNTSKNNPGGATLNPVLQVSGTLTLNGTAKDDSTIVGGINGLNYTVIEVKNDQAKITINSGRYQSHDCVSVIEINEDAELEINGGDFIGGSLGRYGIIVNNGSFSKPKITINGGRFDANITGFGESGHTQGAALIATRGDGVNVEINDGLFTIQYSGTQVDQIVACLDIRSDKAEVSINGGTFINQTAADRCPDVSSQQKAAALFLYEEVKSANISNGYFSCPNGIGGRIYISNGGVETVNIEDVTFIGNLMGLYITNYDADNHVVLNGGYYKAEGTYGGIYVGASSNLDFMWGKVEGAKNGMYIDNNANVSITGGTIQGGTIQGGTGYGIRNYSTGTVTIGGTVNVIEGLYTNNGTININGGQIMSAGYHAIQVAMYQKSASDPKEVLAKINFSGTPIITGGPEHRGLYNAGGIVKIDGGRFYGGAGSTKTVVSTPTSAPIRKITPIIGGGGNTPPPGGEPQPQPQPSTPSDPTTTISDGIYNTDPIEGTGCALVPDYEVFTNPDPSTVAVYPFAIRKKTFDEQTVSEDADRTIDWKNVDTWSGDHIIPDKGDDVTIADSKNVEVGESGHTDAYAHKITVDNGSDLIIDGGSKLTVGNGGIVLGSTGDGGEVIIKANAEDGTGVLLFSPVADVAVTTIEATVELHTTAHKDDEGNYFWNYIGIPLKTDNFMPTNWEKIPVTEGQETGSYLQTWDFTEGWVNKGLEAFKPFQGVAITNDSKDGVIYRFKGTMVGNADKNMQFKPRGYNFFANSYTAPIDIETLLNELKDNGVVDAAVYMFDTENNRFQSVALSAFAGFIPPYFRVIPSMNGFFILNQQTQAAQQLMDYGDAVYNCALGNRPLYAPQHEAMDFSRVHISVESNGSKDGLYLIENNEFTSEFENGYDVMKYMTDGQHNIYAQTAQGSQSELFNSNIEGTMIGFEASADQMEYTLTFDEIQGETFVLTDLETGATVEMSEGNTYTFFAQAGQNNENRFMVTRANKAPTAIDNVKGNVKAQGIYSVMGHYFGNVTEWKNMPSGVYVVNGVKVVK